MQVAEKCLAEYAASLILRFMKLADRPLTGLPEAIKRFDIQIAKGLSQCKKSYLQVAEWL